MLNLPLVGDGPDMEAFKKLLDNHTEIVGIIAVPKHSNPTGDIYSDDKLRAIYKLGSAYSEEFCFIFDHAYIVHDIAEDLATHPILKISEEEGALSTTAVMTSFSKITFGGAGLSFFAGSKPMFDLMVKQRSSMIICPDRLNQQRHLQFLNNLSDIKNHMRLHSSIIKPKFLLVEDKLKNLPADLGNYSMPSGGYFISFNTKKPIAKRAIEISNSMGVKFTPAGATFPYGKDPNDSNIRIAPTFLGEEDLAMAMDVFVLSLKIAHLEAS